MSSPATARSELNSMRGERSRFDGSVCECAQRCVGGGGGGVDNHNTPLVRSLVERPCDVTNCQENVGVAVVRADQSPLRFLEIPPDSYFVRPMRSFCGRITLILDAAAVHTSLCVIGFNAGGSIDQKVIHQKVYKLALYASVFWYMWYCFVIISYLCKIKPSCVSDVTRHP